MGFPLFKNGKLLFCTDQSGKTGLAATCCGAGMWQVEISIPDDSWGRGYSAAELWGDTTGEYSGCYLACEVFKAAGDGWRKVGDAATADSWTFDVMGETRWEVRFKVKAWEGHNLPRHDPLHPTEPNPALAGGVPGEPPGKTPTFGWNVRADSVQLPIGHACTDEKSGTYSGGTDVFHEGHSTAGGIAVPVRFFVDETGGHVSVG